MDWSQYYNNQYFERYLDGKTFKIANLHIPEIIVMTWVNNLIAEPPRVIPKQGIEPLLVSELRQLHTPLTLLLATGEVFILRIEDKLKCFTMGDTRSIAFKMNMKDELTYFKVEYNDSIVVGGNNLDTIVQLVAEESSPNSYNITVKYFNKSEYDDRPNRNPEEVEEYTINSRIFPVLRLEYSIGNQRAIPIYGHTNTIIEDIHHTYSEMIVDMYLSRKNVLLPENTDRGFKKAESNEDVVNVIDPQNMPNLYKRYNAGKNADEDALVPKIFDVSPKEQAYINIMNFHLSLVSMLVGFGQDVLRFDVSLGGVTATEIISKANEMNVTKKNLMYYIERLIIWLNTMDGISENSYDIMFHDNIIEDDNVKRAQLSQDIRYGIISQDWYLKQMYNLTESEILEAGNAGYDDAVRANRAGVDQSDGIEKSLQQTKIEQDARDIDKQFLNNNQNQPNSSVKT